MTVYLDDPDVTLYHGDALETLRGMPDESVHCVVTSPPYWGLRDYGTGAWAGGDPDCDHVQRMARVDAGRPATQVPRGKGGALIPSGYSEPTETPIGYRDVCGKCGAHRTDNQMGLEPTPELYVQNMVAVFREVRRVLRRDGTCWLNIGDSYAANFPGGQGRRSSVPGQRWGADAAIDLEDKPARVVPTGLKPKDLVGIPWRLAFALQQDGWWLRADIIWAKPNPMPESVTDRPTKAHEYVFLLTRSPRYFFDQEAVREPHEHPRPVGRLTARERDGATPEDRRRVFPSPAGRNVRSVWEIATEPFPAAHFATFPTELARRCILAGTSERGCCPECGAPFIRRVERELHPVQRTFTHTAPRDGFNKNPEGHIPAKQTTETVGWDATCTCRQSMGVAGFSLKPCTVLDPFAGACTVPLVARQHGRHSIGIELSETYLRQIALPRLQQLSLLA